MERTDERIKQDIVDSLYWDGRVDASKVNVEVTDGEVTLKGKVSHYAAYRASVEDAWDISGVYKVDNQLVVEYPEPASIPTDHELKTNIQSALSWNPDISDTDIDVSVNNGIVKLEGSVDAYWKKIRAEEIAYDMRGVLKVTNELAVVPTKDIVDQIIAADIMAAYDRNVFVDADSVDVKVEKGKVTLSGTVPSRTAYLTAVDIIRNTIGVIDIDNHLDITR